MRILIAEDDHVSRLMLEATLKKWGYDLVVAKDGLDAWQQIQLPDSPHLMIIDWMMPGMDGVEICRRLRQEYPAKAAYVILLTAKSDKADIVVGLEAGADDYITKPFDRAVLRARVHVGSRTVCLQNELAENIKKLQEALSEVKQLHGILPICSHCKKIRDDKNYWQQVEAYVSAHSNARFTHGICPDCFDNVVNERLESFKRFNYEQDS